MTTLAARQGLDLVRWVLATLLFIHGLARVLAGGVAPFGAFLDAQGFPAGLVLAWAYDHSGTLWTSIGLHAAVNALSVWSLWK